MSARWEPTPGPGDGADGRGESGPREDLETRRTTEEAAWTGRFPEASDDATAEGFEASTTRRVRDDSNPIEPEEGAEDRAGG